MREIYVACAWCRWGIIKLDKEQMIQDIDEFVVTDENVWGGYVCEVECLGWLICMVNHLCYSNKSML